MTEDTHYSYTVHCWVIAEAYMWPSQASYRAATGSCEAWPAAESSAVSTRDRCFMM